MDAAQLQEWRKRHELTQEGTAAALGLSPRMVRYYLQGAKPVPLTVALACLAWDENPTQAGIVADDYWSSED
mgnify:CR=1 FL=1